MISYETVIGLEVHAQLMTRTKAFCFVAHDTHGEPNSRVGPVSAGLPGALPVLNEEVVRLAVRAGLALNCKINLRSSFSRKNYFYPDLPKGYQITQFDETICGAGVVEVALAAGGTKKLGIHHIHIEEDAGKSTHYPSHTLVNLNRAGVPLVEIVSDPDMSNPQEAVAYLKKLHAILVYAEVCDGNLEEGNFRCDANVSVRPVGQKTLGTRTELKNINSFRFIEKALDYEIARHIAVIEGGGRIVQETRGWDAAGNKTYSMRSKEEAMDYRYFPEPDLPPLHLEPAFVQEIARLMPELPEAKRARFVEQYGLSPYDAEILTATRPLARYFEEAVLHGGSPKTLSNWIGSELLRELKDENGQLDPASSKVQPTHLSHLVQLIEKGTISGKIAKAVFQEMITTGQEPAKIVEARGWVQVQDGGQIETWVSEAVARHPAQWQELRGGKEKVMAFFVGEVMKSSRGKASPALVTELLRKKMQDPA